MQRIAASSWRRAVVLGVAASLIALAPARGAATTVAVAPPTASLAPLGTQQFQATVNGVSSTAITWMVNGIPGGAPMIGTISAAGRYTAPADVPAAMQVQIEAEAQSAPLSNGSANANVSASPATGSTFYVATTGSDSGPGTAAQPWQTIQHAVSNVPAGSTVLVHGGTYNELVTITRSGSASAGFITIGAAPGETPIVDGTGLKIPNGENGLFTLQDVSFIRLIGFEVRNYTSNSKNLDPVGIYVVGAGSYIEIRNNHVHDIVTSVQTSVGDALGIAIYGQRAPASLNNVIIDGNELDHLTLGFSESLALSGNVQNFQVTNNLIHDNNNIGIDMAGDERQAPQFAYDRARNGYVAGNTVFNISSITNPAYNNPQPSYGADGIYVDTAENIVIERNLLYSDDIGIEVASEHQRNGQPLFGQNVTVRNNVVHGSNVVGMSIGGYGNGVGGTKNCVIANNTFVGDDTTNSHSGEFQIQFHASGNAFLNNIASATAQGWMVTSDVGTPTNPVMLSHNLYDSPVGAAASIWKWLGKKLTSFTTWTATTKSDRHSNFADPGFVDAAANDYQLAPGSPALGTGGMLPLSQTGLLDFAGSARTSNGKIDIGAFQN